ncbi:hypothetical protein SAMN02745857_03773 [Andreprevotia lacus DSM 23236]|jgi:hypothetical protein|uniref:Uncharacterized protein n=1 Tax=Andreprevotia lacus DSM 23236 TaxID=1121001 RepID=A0A1W1XZM4_9NEIS|nr:hypothetical protein [Andreprevotia lacus]SMC29334.1 hypothetical protein SAMN02745857_03773 [Andreprevotia lacus DSM 23236]
MDVTTKLWEWFCTDELPSIRAYFFLCDALEELASSAEAQSTTLPDCPHCEISSTFTGNYQDFYKYCAELLDQNIEECLGEIDDGLTNLPADAASCFDHSIFKHAAWQGIREQAKAALIALHAEALYPFRAQLEQADSDTATKLI